MFSRISSRATAALIAGLLIVGSVSATTPALAAEPAVSAAATSTKAVAFTGTVTDLGDSEDESSVKLFRVVGFGYLSVDFGAAEIAPGVALTINVSVPTALDLGATPESTFAAVSAYGESEGSLSGVKATGIRAPIGGTAAMVNQTSAQAAVHKVFAVLVTPSSVPGSKAHSSQTAAKVQDAVEHSSDYWSAQSNNKVSFDLAGTVRWYKSKNTCATDLGSTKLWTEAAAKAKATLGYTDAYNNHLVLFFPSTVTSQCGGAIGLGTIGGSINTGGLVWTVGTNSAIGKSTLSHELGHNLSLGHADWADCSSANPNPGLKGTTGCSIRYYGDVLDVMGFGMSNLTGGSLSSPHAIRSGLWGNGDYVDASSSSTSSYTLNPVSSHSGLRSVVVEDNTGVNYFVEFRNYSGEEAQYLSLAGECDSQICVPQNAGVRILRLEDALDVKGAYGDDAFLIGRRVNGVKRVNYTQGESFSTNGISVSVTSVGSDTATISVTRGAIVVTEPDSDEQLPVVLDKTLSYNYDRAYRTNDTFTIFMGTQWVADHFEYQWYLSDGEGNREQIPGATKPNYTIQGVDVGKYLSFTVIAAGPNPITYATDAGEDEYYLGEILPGRKAAGAASIANNGLDLRANPTGWDAGTTFTYQWYRGATPITTAKTQFYTPVAADRGAKLKVRVTGTQPGFQPASADSLARDYTLNATGKLTIGGVAKVGETLAVVDAQNYTTTIDGPVEDVDRDYQWYRDGKAITNQTGAEYVVVSADYAKRLTVRVIATAGGYAPLSKSSPATAKVAKGTITGLLGTLAEKHNLELTATQQWVFEPAGITYSYQWYRGSVAIKKATKSTYLLTNADLNKSLFVKITTKRSNYTSVVRSSEPTNYTVTPSSAIPTFSGNVAIGQVLTVNEREYTNGGAITAIQWLRNGKAIAGMTGEAYALTEADRGAAISVRVTVGADVYLSSTATSVATQKVGDNAFEAEGDVAVTSNGALLLSANPNLTDTSEGAKFVYQWLRDGKPISKATKVTYKLTTADYNKAISVRVTASKATYTTMIRTSAQANWSVVGVSAPKISDTTPKRGQTLSATVPAFSPSTDEGTAVTYQWYINAKAVKAETNETFVVPSSAKGKVITVKVTAKHDGLLSYVKTSAKTAKVK